MEVKPQDILERSDSHQVYERLRYWAATGEIVSLLDWIQILTEDFPYPELAKLAADLDEIARSAVDLSDERDLSLIALKTASQKIRTLLRRIKSRPPKQLVVEQLRSAPDTILDARIEPADDFAIALVLMTGDLVSSGFFRFGRFTTRGYGVVRLQPLAYYVGGIGALLDEDGPSFELIKEDRSGLAFGYRLLRRDPRELIRDEVTRWLK